MPDDFVPDDFVSDETDDFVADDFTADEPEGLFDKAIGAAKKLGRAILGPSAEETEVTKIVDPTATSSLLPSIRGRLDTRAATGESFSPYWEGFLGSLYEDIVRPFATPAGLVGSASPKFPRGARIPDEVLPVESPIIRGLLPEHKERLIAGQGGRVQRESLLNPQEEARLKGYDIGEQGPVGVESSKSPRSVDLAEIREAERVKNLSYTNRDLEGGTPLIIPNRPLMDIPPTAGDTRLGFSPYVDQDVPYPLNVVPQAVQPRSAQTVTRALAGDVKPPVKSSEKVEFVSAKPEPEIPKLPERDLRGGTAALSPDEPILPSAVKAARAKTKDITGLDTSQVKIPPSPVAPVIKKGVENFIKATQNPSILMKSIYTELSKLGPIGKQLTQRFQRANQVRSQYDAAWTEPLFGAASHLRKSEFANFGAYVEGRLPIPNDRVRRAVEKWNEAQNMMGDAAVKAGLHLKRGEEIIPFQKIEKDYWPRIPSERLTKKDIVDRLVENGMSRHEAAIVARRWDNTGEIFLGPQHSRLEKVFKYRDDFDVAIHHGRSMSKRIANHEHLGAKDIAGKGNEGIADLIEETTDPKLAYKLAKRLAGRDELPNEKLLAGVNQARKWMSLSSLPNFTIPNVLLGQATNAQMVALSQHPIKAAREISKLIRSSYRDEMRASGVFNSFNRTLLEELQGIDPFKIGAGEKINRAIAGAIGKSTIREAFTDYKSGKNVASARYFIETLLARNPDEITAITPELERFAAGRMAEITQGLNNPGNLPYGWSNPVNTYGSAATQLMLIFKKVGFQVTKTVKDTIKVNPKVAIPAWAAITQVAGEMTGDVKSLITGRERPEELAFRIVDNWGNAFMLGLPWELATSAQYGPSALISSALGPAYGKASEFAYDVTKTGQNLYNETDDPFSPLRRFALKNLPFPGRERVKTAVEED